MGFPNDTFIFYPYFNYESELNKFFVALMAWKYCLGTEFRAYQFFSENFVHFSGKWVGVWNFVPSDLATLISSSPFELNKNGSKFLNVAKIYRLTCSFLLIIISMFYSLLYPVLILFFLFKLSDFSRASIPLSLLVFICLVFHVRLNS